MKFKRFDIAEHLVDQKMVAQYLSAVLEEEDPPAFIAALCHVIEAQDRREGSPLPENLSRVLRSARKPSFEAVAEILEILGLRFSLKPKRKAKTTRGTKEF